MNQNRQPDSAFDVPWPATVRGNPLASIAAAVALGAVIARLAR